MRNFLHITIGLSVIFLALLVTATSCNKVGGDKSNSGGGGDNVRGCTTGAETNICFENFDASIAEMVGDTIQLKADGFPTQSVDPARLSSTIEVVKTAGAAHLKRAFDITISSGGSDATAGLVLVGPRSLKGHKDPLTMTNVTNFFIDKGVGQALTAYDTALQIEGIVSEIARATDDANGFVKKGWNIFGVFMNPSFLSDTDAVLALPDAKPFAFTHIQPGTLSDTKPILICRTVVSSITNAAAIVPGTMQLTGSETASCYVGALGKPFTGEAANNWLSYPSGAGGVKKKFNIAIAGVKTDGKTIDTIGLTAVDKVGAFTDGISTAEMKEIADANPSAYKKVAVEIVKGGFTYTPPPAGLRFYFPNSADVRMNTAGDTIEIKARAFPTAVADTAITAVARDLELAATGSLKRVFNIFITPPGDSSSVASGGLIMVGPGNYTKVDDFTDTTGTGGGVLVLPSDFEEGYASGPGTNRAASAAEFQPAGWSHYGVFMNDTAPTSAAEADADASPFAFTASSGSQPFLFCRTTLTYFRGGVSGYDKFIDGEVAHCYIGSKGNAFTGARATTWLNTTASDTFKKTFNIAIGAIMTDQNNVFSVLPGVNYKDRRDSLSDGLSSEEIADIMTRFPSAFKKVAVTIVRDDTW